MIEIVNKEECCGCTACVNICSKNCIAMEEDGEGFSYPRVNKEQCINCNVCIKVCPVMNAQNIIAKENKYLSAFLVQHRDDDICKESTSGGMFSAIAEYVLQKKGVVFGVEFTPEFKVVSNFVETSQELWRFRNSKYVQSNPKETFKQAKEFLEKGRLVCYSGTPCQIEGLRQYLGRKYDNLILVDIVCRAVPSPGLWREYVNYITRLYGKQESIRFRDKTLGYQYSTMEIKGRDGNVQRDGIESQQWLRMFFSGMIIRPSCTTCRFRGQYRNSDFTIWDCFNVYQIDKSFDEDRGTTRVLVQSESGKKIFEEIKLKLKWAEIPVEVAVKNVKEMSESPQFHPQREDFFADLEIYPLEKLMGKYFPIDLKVKVKRSARRLLNYIGIDKKLKHILR